MDLILDAHRRGDAATIAAWSTPEAATQLSSYPPDAFDTALLSCSPQSEHGSDVTCNLKAARVPIGDAMARLERTEEGYRLVLIVPVVD